MELPEHLKGSLSAVPPEYRMTIVPDVVIRNSLAHLDPSSSIARAMCEVLCLRETIQQMVRDQLARKWPK